MKDAFFFLAGARVALFKRAKGSGPSSPGWQSVELQVNRMKIFCADLAVSIFGVCECLCKQHSQLLILCTLLACFLSFDDICRLMVQEWQGSIRTPSSPVVIMFYKSFSSLLRR